MTAPPVTSSVQATRSRHFCGLLLVVTYSTNDMLISNAESRNYVICVNLRACITRSRLPYLWPEACESRK